MQFKLEVISNVQLDKMGTLQVVQGPELCHQILCKGAAATLLEITAYRPGLLLYWDFIPLTFKERKALMLSAKEIPWAILKPNSDGI